MKGDPMAASTLHSEIRRESAVEMLMLIYLDGV